MTLLLGFAFLSGLATILAPCIWPILPIILSASSTGGHRKPLGITLGIMLSFGVLTLSISYLERLIPFDPNVLRWIAVIIIATLGLCLVVPALSLRLESLVSRLSGRFANQGSNTSTGFWSGFLTGLSLGIIWTPCAGPILATIATLAATQAVNINVILVTVFYVLGVGVPLFIFATLGKYLFTKSQFLAKYTGRIQQIFGVVMILTALAIATNYDRIIQTKLLDFFPSYSQLLNNFESNPAVTQQLNQLKSNNLTNPPVVDTADKLLNADYPAPELVGLNKWLNPETTLTMAQLKGKVVLIDFWTYTCINCLRTMPYVTAWYDKYHDQGFTVIGVHTPEFEFEKDTNNVQNAIKQYSIHYPVAQDNDYTTWKNYNNQYWPAEYLVDAKGMVRRVHFGEGEYDQMELAIQTLLKENGATVSASLTNMPDQTPAGELSPETYVGSKRMEFYYPNGSLSPGAHTFTLNGNPPVNSFSFGGNWDIADEYSTADQNATLNYHFNANKVFLVLRPGSAGPKAQIKVSLDGQPITTATGDDVQNGILTVNTDRLYNLVNLHGRGGDHILKLEFLTPGIEAFAFTFG